MWLSPGQPSAVVYQISSKSDDFSLRERINGFQNDGRPPSLIFEIDGFVMWPLLACRSAASCKVSLKSDNRLTSYGQKRDFQHGRRPPS